MQSAQFMRTAVAAVPHLRRSGRRHNRIGNLLSTYSRVFEVTRIMNIDLYELIFEE